MINPNGSISINGITDLELAKILEVKAKHQGNNAFSFNPQQMSSATTAQGQSFYGSVTFQWNGEQGLQIVYDLLQFLLKKDEQAKAQGQ